ncbi:proline rich membrane anchor 1 [Cricetulus griseus]
MLLRDLVLRRGCCWPSLLLHCALHPLWGFVQVTHAEPQKSCSKVTDSCQHICQCRPPPPLPPPPPPPPPPRLLSAPAVPQTGHQAFNMWPLEGIQDPNCKSFSVLEHCLLSKVHSTAGTGPHLLGHFLDSSELTEMLGR